MTLSELERRDYTVKYKNDKGEWVTRQTWSYGYLSEKDSHRLDEVKYSTDPKDQEIVALILDKASASRSAHRASTY